MSENTQRTIKTDNTNAGPIGDVIRVQDAGDTKQFRGVKLSWVSTESERTPRWTEMALYKMTDGTERYVLHVIGRSVIYHEVGSACNSGVSTNSTNVPGDAEPCFKCNPANRGGIPIEDVVAMEEDRYTVHVCATPERVVAQLRNPRMGGRTAGVISGPGQRLLNEAALKDDGIRNMITTVVSI